MVSPLIQASNQGIQTLLEAEKEASKIVAKARQCIPWTNTDRIQRLKDARTEAQKEVLSLKTAKTTEFAEFEAAYQGTVQKTEDMNKQATERELAEMQACFDKNKQQIVQELVKHVTDCQPKLHPNAKLQAR